MKQKLPVFLSGFSLKVIALITMTIDHVGLVLFPKIVPLRAIGRIAFPIFAFLLVEGYLHTKDLKKYLLRLFLFALISEVPFDLAFYGKSIHFTHQNTLFTLTVGLLAVFFLDHFRYQLPGIALAAVCALAVHFGEMDYHTGGVLLIAAFFILRDKPLIKLVFTSLLLLLLYNPIEAFGIIGILLTYFYNGERGAVSMKYLFYVYYPLHLFTIYLAKMYMISAK